MRIATLIVSLFVTAIVTFQACTLAVLTDDDSQDAAAAGGGLIVAFLMLLGAAFVMAFPLVSLVFFALAAVIAIPTGVVSDYDDLIVWGVLCLVLVPMSFLGWRGKRRAQMRERVERDTHVHAAVAAGLAAAGVASPSGASTVTCPRCSAVSPASIRFCPQCGLQRTA